MTLSRGSAPLPFINALAVFLKSLAQPAYLRFATPKKKLMLAEFASLDAYKVLLLVTWALPRIFNFDVESYTAPLVYGPLAALFWCFSIIAMVCTSPKRSLFSFWSPSKPHWVSLNGCGADSNPVLEGSCGADAMKVVEGSAEVRSGDSMLRLASLGRTCWHLGVALRPNDSSLKVELFSTGNS